MCGDEKCSLGFVGDDGALVIYFLNGLYILDTSIALCPDNVCFHQQLGCGRLHGGGGGVPIRIPGFLPDETWGCTMGRNMSARSSLDRHRREWCVAALDNQVAVKSGSSHLVAVWSTPNQRGMAGDLQQDISPLPFSRVS